MPDAQDRARPPPDHQEELLKTIEELGYRHGHWQVFADFVEMAAVSISNATDLVRREKREERYMQVIKRYSAEELARFPKMLAFLTMALEEEPSDVLGLTFHDLELHNKWSAQYFSPYPLCRMMAKMTIADKADLETRISERGFVTAQEPAAGSGAMIIALAHEMREAGVNYQQHLHVTAIEVDPKCVHMSYLQFSLLHIPAVIVHGNSLSLEEFDRWYTPAHILHGWDWKLRRPSEGAHTLQTVLESEHQPKRPRDDEPPAPPTQLALF
jgi:type I restriction-modification system DNA methylase subunit